jgi:hypothetical protein
MDYSMLRGFSDQLNPESVTRCLELSRRIGETVGQEPIWYYAVFHFVSISSDQNCDLLALECYQEIVG